MTDKQPEALRLADVVDRLGIGDDVAVELRRLHEENKALRARLAQPEKEWVGLTDAEAMEIEDTSPDIRWAIIQAEAKLKEKNT